MTDRTGGVDVVDGLDWDLIADRYWDRRPVLIRLPGGPSAHPFRPDDVFGSAVAATVANAAGEIPKHVRFAVDRDLKSRPDGWLPLAEDDSLDGYAARLAERLDGRRYSLTVQAFHAFHHPLWRRERAFYDGAFRRFGLPLSSAITTMFHGNYEHTQIGAHKDRFASFMFALQGRKVMRFWPERPWTEAVTSVLDYERHLPGSFAVEVHAGEMLYWPSSHYHVGESALDDTPATSVNVGLPREFTRAAFEVAEYLTDPTPSPCSARRWRPSGCHRLRVRPGRRPTGSKGRCRRACCPPHSTRRWTSSAPARTRRRPASGWRRCRCAAGRPAASSPRRRPRHTGR